VPESLFGRRNWSLWKVRAGWNDSDLCVAEDEACIVVGSIFNNGGESFSKAGSLIQHLF
jgi:hypothetical protein